MVNHYSCCTYVNNQVQCSETRFNCKQRNGDAFYREKKNHFSDTPSWISHSSTIVFVRFYFLLTGY